MKVTLEEMLYCREERVQVQQSLIEKHNLPIVSFTMNIAGPVKTSPLIERGFNEGLRLLLNAVSEKNVKEKTVRFLKTGPEGYISVNLPPREIKKICTRIEEQNALGRLFDMDVIGKGGEKLVRENERGCIVCGKAGRECAASRAHSVKEIAEITNNILLEYFKEKDSERISLLAKESLIDEVETTPKAGLVDKNNCGSHADMNLESFKKSAEAIEPYFKTCVLIGIESAEKSFDETFSLLRKAGLKAEEKMFAATGGVNTHKGAIYSLGIILGALGRLYSAEKPIAETKDILAVCAKLSEKSAMEDFEKASGKTAGEKLYLESKIKGIRGEALLGFPSVKNIALPVFEKMLSDGYNRNDAASVCLVHLIASVEDTTLYKRGGKDGANYAKSYAQSLISEGVTHKKLLKMDEEFIKRNLSAGGCADLLALTLFLHDIKQKGSF